MNMKKIAIATSIAYATSWFAWHFVKGWNRAKKEHAETQMAREIEFQRIKASATAQMLALIESGATYDECVEEVRVQSAFMHMYLDNRL